MPVSVDELCRRAGVARITAYRVISGRVKVAEPTRQKVLRAMEELGCPKMRSRSRRARGRGIVLWGPLGDGVQQDPLFADIYKGLETAMAGRGRALSSISCPLPEEGAGLPVELLREKVDGVLTIGLYNRPLLAAMAKRWPLCCLLSSQLIPGAVAVAPDYGDGVRQAVEHLLARGHRRIGLVTGLIQERNLSRQMYEGYAGALLRAGLTVGPALVHSDAGNVGRIKPGKPLPLARQAGLTLLTSPSRPTAIVAREDSEAGLLAAAAELGLAVPGDLSFVLVGGRTPAAQEPPRMTRVACSADELAEIALRAVTLAPPRGARILVPVELREGSSVRDLRG
ncbi:MAG TPA: LacI family DNA-binding transcriptional regulator [Planctomycetota bacterium]|nr:LacI family DNA-binding transcriptional regulator [Planctomycetota bacterium]